MFHPHHPLTHRLRCAEALTPALFSDVVAQTCTRLPALRGAADRVARLAADGAWTDAALALIAFELPAWQVRRLVFEDHEWICCLSRHPDLPVELDDTAEGVHEHLPLAILGAFLDACGAAVAEQPAPAGSLPQMRPGAYLCCDDFA